MTCEHKDHEDCLICCDCGRCSESLDDEDYCADCGTQKCKITIVYQ